MTKRTKIALLALGAATLVAAGGGAALAANAALSTEEDSKAVIDDAAEQLGVEPSELTAALKQALENRVDEAVAAGRLTEEQGDALKERIESDEIPLLFGALGGPGPERHGGHYGHFGHFASLEAAASYLGLTEQELRSELGEGQSLAEIAKEQGKSVAGLVQSLVQAASERIDQAVDDGKLTEAQAADIEQDLEKRITELVNRDPGSGSGLRGPGFRGPGLPAPRFGERFGQRFGPGFDGFDDAPFRNRGPHA